MSSLVSSSIGKKLFMSITGLFLITFLTVHLAVNMLLIFDDSGELYNIGAHFMATNPIIKIVEPVLAIGFLLHILYGVYLTIQNMKARPVRYNKVDASKSSSWTSRNMFILGGLILVFLVLHIMNFYWKMKITGDVPAVVVDGQEMHDAYTLVTYLFKNYFWYDVVYILAGVFLGLHLSHGFWSAFQTIGFSNNIWRKRLSIFGNLFAFVIAAGFVIIPLYFIIKF